MPSYLGVEPVGDGHVRLGRGKCHEVRRAETHRRRDVHVLLRGTGRQAGAQAKARAGRQACMRMQAGTGSEVRAARRGAARKKAGERSALGSTTRCRQRLACTLRIARARADSTQGKI